MANAQPTGSPPPLDALPPGPSAPAVVQGPVFARDPQGALLRSRARFGPVFTLRLAGVGPVVVAGTPDAVDVVAARDPGGSHAGEARREVLPQASRRSMFGSDGEEHRNVRARVAPAFDAARVQARQAAMVARAEAHVDAWPVGRPFALLSRMRTLAEDLFVRFVLGVEDETRARMIVQAVGRTLRTPGNPPLAPPDRDELGPVGPLLHAEFERRLAPLRGLLLREVADRRAGRIGEGDGILDHVAATPMSDERIVDELLVVLAAAQEPPAIGLTRVVDRYARDPALVAHLDDAGPDDPAFDAVASEALRLHPPAMASLRRLTRDAEVGGHALPAGTDVMVPFTLLHRDPEVWADPHRFDPSRFLGGPPPPTFLPFGVGERRCPGEPLSGVELRAVVPTVLRRLTLRPLSRAPERAVQRATVLVPQRSGLVVATRR
jgi:cytochrome P450